MPEKKHAKIFAAVLTVPKGVEGELVDVSKHCFAYRLISERRKDENGKYIDDQLPPILSSGRLDIKKTEEINNAGCIKEFLGTNRNYLLAADSLESGELVSELIHEEMTNPHDENPLDTIWFGTGELVKE